MKEGTCNTCHACRMVPDPATKVVAWVCRRHPPQSLLIPKGQHGGQLQVDISPVWPGVNPSDETFFCLDWVEKPNGHGNGNT